MKITFQSILMSLTVLAAIAKAAPESPPYEPCPECVPFPGQNKCDITTSCIGVQDYGAPYYCACRHGYRASDSYSYDPSIEFRLNWPGQEGRVFVEPGTACDKLCDDWQLGKDGCKDVPIRYECRSDYHYKEWVKRDSRGGYRLWRRKVE